MQIGAPMSWHGLKLYAAEASDDKNTIKKHPTRTLASANDYEKYIEWCELQGITNAEYVERHANWENGGKHAFEPCTFPYFLDPTIQHWVLWHHPKLVPGTTTLVPKEELTTVAALVGADGKETSLKNNAICFQNLPSLRSIPTIAHSHLFIRTSCELLLGTLARRRSAWLTRSPFFASVSNTSRL